MEKKLIIEKKTPKGEDGYRVFSIRIKEELVLRLDKASLYSNRSRNELINMFIEFGLDNSEIR